MDKYHWRFLPSADPKGKENGLARSRPGEEEEERTGECGLMPPPAKRVKFGSAGAATSSPHRDYSCVS